MKYPIMISFPFFLSFSYFPKINMKRAVRSEYLHHNKEICFGVMLKLCAKKGIKRGKGIVTNQAEQVNK